MDLSARSYAVNLGKKLSHQTRVSHSVKRSPYDAQTDKRMRKKRKKKIDQSSSSRPWMSKQETRQRMRTRSVGWKEATDRGFAILYLGKNTFLSPQRLRLYLISSSFIFCPFDASAPRPRVFCLIIPGHILLHLSLLVLVFLLFFLLFCSPSCCAAD